MPGTLVRAVGSTISDTHSPPGRLRFGRRAKGCLCPAAGTVNLFGTREGFRYLLVSQRDPRTLRRGGGSFRTICVFGARRSGMKPSADISSFPKLLKDFFCIYLMNQKNVSCQTVASYCDTFRLLLLFVRKHRCTEPSDLALLDINANLVLEFLHYLEAERGNSIQTRNARLAAIRSFVKYASLRDPRFLVNTESSLAIPLKRTETRLVGYLSRDGMTAILEAPDRSFHLVWKKGSVDVCHPL